jgi:hypothetical protein
VVNQTSVAATYLFVQPKAATTAASSGGSSAAPWVIAVVVVIAIVLALGAWLRRRGKGAVEETA